MTAVMTFYRFVDLDAVAELRDALESAAVALQLEGTVILASEGVNGTLAGAREHLEAFRTVLHEHAAFAGMTCRFTAAEADKPIFHRLKVVVRPEIVALRQPGVRPVEATGEHVGWEQWHALLDAPDVVVVDTRNAFEVAVGSFPGAIDPGTKSFREWPGFVAAALDPSVHRRVAMFCTGGIRCEKASAYLLDHGFEHVYQLDGGVLGYLEQVPEAESRWQGECYVFDRRVSVDTALAEGTFEQCDACGRPLTPQDRAAPGYEPGISCLHCAPLQTPERRAAFAERRRQEVLAASRGERHVGAVQRPRTRGRTREL
jgi:UPF0176 protein